MSKRRLKITVISGLSLVVSCANESETNSSVATKNSTEDLERAGNKRPDLKTPPLTIEENLISQSLK